MYLNTIRFDHNKVSMFLTSEECFTPSNPVYKAVQNTLEKIGFKPECNHVFIGELGRLHFTHSETNYYSPISDAVIYEHIKHNRMQLKAASELIGNLEYIFSTGVPAEHVETILKIE